MPTSNNQGFTIPPDGPALYYVSQSGTLHSIDAHSWQADAMNPRDRAICRALLAHASDKITEASVGTLLPVTYARRPCPD